MTPPSSPAPTSPPLPPEVVGLPPRTTPEAAAAQFDALQARLVPLWRSIREMTTDEQTIVVVPSMNIDLSGGGAVLQAYEERFLFLLLLLMQPQARLIYVTSQAIAPDVIDYYLGLLPGIIPSHARRRLHLVSPLDGSSRPLSVKLLQRPRLLEQIRRLIPDPNRAHLVPYNTTWLERNLALRLGLPMYGADPKFFPLGTKSGGRKLFARAGVPHPFGRENLHTRRDIIEAIVAIRAAHPTVRKVIVKLNEGVSGEGNAQLAVDRLPEPGDTEERAAIEERLAELAFELPGTVPEEFFAKFAQRGGIVEERVGVGAAEIRSPSVQLRATPLGELQLLSTHDQILGGASGQSYLGCRFPADPEYAALISREAAKVGKLLVEAGVLGRFALDFVVVRPRPAAPWDCYAIEINLRKGGTTHPFLTLQFLTGGSYDAESATFTTRHGEKKFLVASDHLDAEAFRAYTPEDLFTTAVRHGLHFTQTRQTGVVFHMLPALGEVGRLGLTAVGNSPEEAEGLMRRCEELLRKDAGWQVL